jgi:hypothetical protein
MSTTRISAEQFGDRNHETTCPYNSVTICMASLSSMVIDLYQREQCCGTDNYDNCPMFLSKVMRKG